MALQAFMRMIGLGKSKEKGKGGASNEDVKADEDLPCQKPLPRRHPYDEITEEDLQTNRNGRAPRVHPYDEVSEETLEANRDARDKPVRRHNYDNIDLDRTNTKLAKNSKASAEASAVKKGSGASSSLNYVEVDIQPGPMKGGAAARPAQAQSTVYSEVRPGTVTGGVAVLND